MVTTRGTALLALLLISPGAFAQEATTEISPGAESPGVDLDVYSGPRSIEFKAPRYPKSRQLRLREGWVQLNLMVDTEGRPYEIAVTDSTGDEAFEQSAIEAMEASTFEPASMNGEPIDAGYNVKVRFALEGGDQSARPAFAHAYRRVMDAVGKGDRRSAEALLAELDVRNLYEDAHYHLARYAYLEAWGSPSEQLAAIKRAIAHESDATYLPDEMFTRALQSKFALQLQVQDFGGALQTWGTLRTRDLSDPVRQSLEGAIAEIKRLKSDDRAFSVTGRIANGTSWYFALLKKRFQIDKVNGAVAEIKLRCDTDFVFFRHDPQMRYSVADRFGDCRLEVVGDPGTTFRLVQG